MKVLTNERFFFIDEGKGISTILFFIQPYGSVDYPQLPGFLMANLVISDRHLTGFVHDPLGVCDRYLTGHFFMIFRLSCQVQDVFGQVSDWTC